MEESDKTGDWTQGYQFEQLLFHHYINWTTTSPHPRLSCDREIPFTRLPPSLLLISHELQVMYGAGFCWPVLSTTIDKGLSGGLATRL